MKKQVMVKAWDIAKKAVAKHGGKAIEYIAEAMKIAWALIGKLEKVASQSIALNPEQAVRLGGEENAVRLAVAQAVESGQVELFIEELEKDVINKLESLAKESIKLNPEQAERLGNEEQAVRFLVEQAIEEDAVMEYIQELEKDIESKKNSNEPLYIEILEGSRKHKSYIAEVVGDHPIYKIERKFISEQHENLRIKYAYLENGKVYEIQEAGDREYVKVENGQMVEISKDEVVELGVANNN